MQKIIAVMLLAGLAGCNENQHNSVQAETSSTESAQQANRPRAQMPNALTKIVNIKTDDLDGDVALMQGLNSFFKQQKFKIVDVVSDDVWSYNDCQNNMQLRIEGSGVTRYYIKRTEAKPKNYYPDYVMWVMQFADPNQAQQVEQQIRAAKRSGQGFCNGKNAEYFVRDGRNVIHLSTRAHMFIDYIQAVVDYIEAHPTAVEPTE